MRIEDKAFEAYVQRVFERILPQLTVLTDQIAELNRKLGDSPVIVTPKRQRAKASEATAQTKKTPTKSEKKKATK